MYFFGVQAAVTHQFSGKQQHRNLVAIAHSCGRVGIDVDYVDAKGPRRRQRGEFGQHFFAQAAPRA